MIVNAFEYVNIKSYIICRRNNNNYKIVIANDNEFDRQVILVFQNIDVHPTDVVVRNKPRKGFLLFQSLCIDAGHVSENALYILLNKANVQANIVITFILTKPSDPKCFDSLFHFFPICFNCSSRARLHQENAFLFTVTVIEIFVTFI